MRRVHLRGFRITETDRSENSYLLPKQSYHTACGYLLDDTIENIGRTTWNKEDVTCVLCLNKIKKS